METKKRSIPRVRNIKRQTKSSPKEILAYANVIFDVTLKAAALSIIIGAFVAHNYLAGIGYLYLFSSMLGSQGGLMSIVFGFGLFIFLMSLLLAAGPVYLWHLRNEAIKKEEFKQLYTIHRLALLQISTQASLLIGSHFASKYHPVAISIVAIFACVFVWNFSAYGSRKYFIFRRWTNNKKQYFGSLFDNVFSMALAMILPIVSWIFLLQIVPVISKSIPVSESYFDTTQYIVLIIWILFYSYASSFVVLAGQANRSEILKRVGFIVAFTMTLFAVLIPQMFLDAGMYIISMREKPSEGHWYVIKQDAFDAVMPVSNMQTVRHIGDQFYIKAYSPFSYGDKKILCDPSIEKPTAKQCVLLSDAEARPATLIETSPSKPPEPKADKPKAK
jgi:hypothetical protein